MTREEAARILEMGGWWDSLNPDISDADMNPLQDALDIAINALRHNREKPISGWISAKERLPGDMKYNGTVLATDGVTVITAPASSVTPAGAITHWMPLPSPPED